MSDNLVAVEKVNGLVSKRFGQSKPRVYQDNQSAVKLIGESVGKSRTKHLTARLACVKEAAKDWNVKFVRTKEMLADVLTKPKGTT
ncbi:MAG: hypothetical protein ACK559_29975, partial [bacterium]